MSEVCCICNTNYCDFPLLCDDTFCRECIYFWLEHHDTCPVCNELVKSWSIKSSLSHLRIYTPRMIFIIDTLPIVIITTILGFSYLFI